MLENYDSNLIAAGIKLVKDDTWLSNSSDNSKCFSLNVY